MSAVLKSQVVSAHPPNSLQAVPSRRRQRRSTPSQRFSTVTPPAVLATVSQQQRPVWLKLMVVGQRLSLATAVLAVSGALSAYALTVDTNRRLSAATTALGHLQDQQQQLTTANAVFKNHLAQTALTNLQANALHPKDVIFLEAPAQTSPPQAIEPTPSEATQTPPFLTDQRFFPKGY